MLNNSKGQAFIESLLILPVSLLVVFYLVYLLLFMTLQIAIDDALESYLLCSLQNKTTCTQTFQQNLAYLPLAHTSYQLTKNQDTYTVDFESQIFRLIQIRKQRTLNYETKI